MKANKIFAVALAALALVGLNSCEKKVIEVESVTIDQSVANLKVGETVQLAATILPEGAEATIEWSSSAEAVATVAEGLVTAVAEGQAIITAKAGTKTASCIVKVGADGPAADDFSSLLNHDSYYVFALDGTSFEKIASKVKDDFRINGSYEGETIPAETTSVLEIWNTDLDKDANWPAISGLNCFGLNEGWIAMNSGTCSWGNMCGGIRQVHRNIDLTGVDGDYTLAIVYKTPANNAASAQVEFTLYGTKEGSKVALNGKANTDGEWTLLSVPVSELMAKGLDYSAVINGDDTAFYTIGLVIGGVGQGLEVDAVLLYK